MASSRFIRRTKMSDGSTFRESYSAIEYLFLKIFEFFWYLIKMMWFILPYYWLVKIPYWIIKKLLNLFSATRSFSEKMDNKNWSINEINWVYFVLSVFHFIIFRVVFLDIII